MASPDSRERLGRLAIGLLVLLGPVLILVITLELLILFGDLTLSDISLVEFLELYIIDLLLFIGLAYGIYRLTWWLVEGRRPASRDTLDARDTTDSTDDDSEPTEDL
jgi:hypothetical protein